MTLKVELRMPATYCNRWQRGFPRVGVALAASTRLEEVRNDVY